jgi:bacteriocin biosynthesis cyclodehydratase domain-containing protein
MKPRLPSHLTVRVEPPDGDGEEMLVFTSARRRIAIKGHSFREFAELVMPLLDGRLTLAEIQERVADTFAAKDLAECIELLSRQHLLEDAETLDVPPRLAERLAPQLGYFREVGGSPTHLQQRLREATVTVVGLGALGAAAALSLAASGIGRIRCLERQPVAPTDPFLAQAFSLADVGRPRVDVVRERIACVNPDATVETIGDALESDSDVADAIRGADLALDCLDPGLASLTYKLNRACLEGRMPCCFGEVSAFEGIVGPTVLPLESACYLCYQMRLVACAEDPEDAFAGLKLLDRRRADDSGVRENLAFCTGVVGNMIALEGFKLLLGGRSSTVGSVLVIDFTRGISAKHVVLRKPWCPACFRPARTGNAAPQ